MAVPRARVRRPHVEDPEKERDDWVRLLNDLVGTVEGWIRPEWSTRRIEKEMYDSVLKGYKVPALLMQREIARVLLEPITRFTPGTDGVVDLYLMPAYDNIARLYRVDGDWKLNYTFRSEKVEPSIRNAKALPVTEENFLRVLAAFAGNAL